MPRRRRWLEFRHPTQLVVGAFALASALGTLALLLPASRAGDEGASVLTALFTSVSAVCVTGLTVVNTETYWSPFGHVVLLVLIQIGGFGIMSLGSLIVLAAFRRVGLRQRLVAQTETNLLQLGDVRSVLRGVGLLTVAIELVAAAVLAGRFAIGQAEPLGRALWLGVFHAVSAFNNAGFALYEDGLVRFVDDAWVSITVAATIVLGGLGFPVLLELGRRWRSPSRWSVHTKLTLLGSAVLLAVGIAAVTALEWTNPATIGGLDVPGRLLAGMFQGVTPRTAGFNTIEYGDARATTLLVTDILMFIGAGSAGTGGGIKVTTFAVLGYAIWAELRGDPDVSAFRRRLPGAAVRQALAVALLGVAAVVLGTLVLLAAAKVSLDAALFEAASAFGTVGLTTGITPHLPDSAKLLLVALMFVGRLGPITLFTALVLRDSNRRFRHPEERPIIG